MPKATVAPTHDADGNLLSDGRWDYVWDAENRLVSMTTNLTHQATGEPYRKLVFGYDWMGRRIRKQVFDNPSATTPIEDLRFAYDGWNLLAEYSVSNSQPSTLNPQRTYTWGTDLSGTEQGAGGVGGLLAVSIVNPQSSIDNFTPSCDGNGNITGWVDSSGDLAASQEYDPFGNMIVREGSVDVPFDFSTKYRDKETGLLYYGHRYLDTVSGRWRSRDPIEEQGGVSLYGFIGNGVIWQYDVFGLKGSGHHIVPWHIFNGKVSAEVQKFFDSDLSRIFNDYYKSHNTKTLNGISHYKYNKAIKQALQDFLGEKKLRDMTEREAKKFVRKIRNLPANHPITLFNQGVANEAAKAMKESLAAAAKSAAARSIDDAVKAGASKFSGGARRGGAVLGALVTGYFFVKGQNEQGLANQYLDDIANAADVYGNGDPNPLNGSFVGDGFRLLKGKLNDVAPHIMGATICDITGGIETKIEVNFK